MERGLLWLPLLGIFIWLYRQGRNEFEKVQAYENWASQFSLSKYDIYAVLGQNGSDLSWGKPTRTGIIDLQTFSLKDVESIYLIVDEKRVSLETPPRKGRAALEFVLPSGVVRVPFTEISLAAKWGKHLQGELQKLHQGL